MGSPVSALRSVSFLTTPACCDSCTSQSCVQWRALVTSAKRCCRRSWCPALVLMMASPTSGGLVGAGSAPAIHKFPVSLCWRPGNGKCTALLLCFVCREAFTALKLTCWLNTLEKQLFSAPYETKDCQQKFE